ncbi:MAG: SsrA-binding protein SmpB [Alphaproteobacteria bacterium]|nr:SsrA-binding protein SmpB [Alphaproteobacteria bacterium]
MSVKKKGDEDNTIARNRRATFDYLIESTVEAGLILTGTEVKSCREGKVSINEAYAGEKNGVLYLLNANISEYGNANFMNHEPKRPRQLLLHKKEMNKLLGVIARKGYTLVPMALYFNARGIVKVKIGVGKGKKHEDKREAEKQRDWSRQKERILKD